MTDGSRLAGAGQVPEDAMAVDPPVGSVPPVVAGGYPAAPAAPGVPPAPAAAGDAKDDDDDAEFFVDIGECRDFDEEAGEPEEEDQQMGAELDDEQAGPDMSVLTLENSGSVLCCAVSSKMAVCTGNQDDKAMLFQLAMEGDKLAVAQSYTLAGHTDSVVCVAFSHDGELLATASMDNTVRVWKVADGSLAFRLDGPASEVDWVAWHPKGLALLAGSQDCTAWMWWAPTGKLMNVFAGHSDKVGCGCFANQGKAIVTGSAAGEIIIWNPKQGTTVHMLSGAHKNGVLCLRGHPTMPIVAAGGFEGTVSAIQVDTGRELAKFHDHEHEVEAVDFFVSASVNMLATGGIDGRVRIYDCEKWVLRTAIEAHAELSRGVTHLRWHPTEPYVVSTGTDARLRAYDARTGAEVAVRSGHRKDVYEFAWLKLPSGAVRAVTASDDGTGKVFEL